MEDDKLIRYCLNWPESLLTRLRKAAKGTGFTIAVIVRRACDNYLKELGF